MAIHPDGRIDGQPLDFAECLARPGVGAGLSPASRKARFGELSFGAVSEGDLTVRSGHAVTVEGRLGGRLGGTAGPRAWSRLCGTTPRRWPARTAAITICVANVSQKPQLAAEPISPPAAPPTTPMRIVMRQPMGCMLEQ